MTLILLPRDPTCLFAFWDTIDNTINTGLDGQEQGIPYLKIKNKTNGNSFLVRVNDFSDSWYITVPDPSSTYIAEFCRRFPNDVFKTFAISNEAVTSENSISDKPFAEFVDFTEAAAFVEAAGFVENSNFVETDGFNDFIGTANRRNTSILPGHYKPVPHSIKLLEYIQQDNGNKLICNNVSSHIG